MKRFFAVCLLLCLLACITACKDDAERTITLISDGTVFAEVKSKGECEIILPTPDGNADRSFDGWYFDDKTYERLFTANTYADEPLSSDITLYAKYVAAVKKYTVTFDTQGGEALASYIGSTVSTVPNAKRTGYALKGWTTDLEADSTVVYPYILTENVTFYAVWEPLHYTISFTANGGICEKSETEVIFDKEIALPSPTKAGYDFGGWYTNDNTLFEDNIYSIAADLALFAKWNPHSYKVTFKNGDDIVDEKTVKTGDSLTVAAAPKKDGYAFSGWYRENVRIIDGYVWNIDGDAVLTARWVEEAKTFNGLILDKNGSNYSVIGYDAAATEVIIPAEIEGLPVTEIAAGAFIDKVVTAITLCGVKYIGMRAFFGCTSLSSITFGEGLLSVGDSAFYGCSALTAVYFPSSVKQIGFNAFESCDLRTVDFSKCDSLTTIKNNAFADNEALPYVCIPLSVTAMGSTVFLGSNSVVIYAAASKCPDGWEIDFNSSDTERPVYYGIAAPAVSNSFQYVVSRTTEKATITKYLGTETIVDIPSTLGGYAVSIVGRESFSGCELFDATVPDGITVEDVTLLAALDR